MINELLTIVLNNDNKFVKFVLFSIVFGWMFADFFFLIGGEYEPTPIESASIVDGR